MKTTKRILVFQLLTVLVTLSLLGSMTPSAPARGAIVSLTLYGDGMRGWGLSPDTLSIPGPPINIDRWDQLDLTLVSVDGVGHNFGVDYNANREPDSDEPLSNYFGGGNATIITYSFNASAVPGTYGYYCYTHPGIQFGYFVIGGNQNPVAAFTLQPSSPSRGQQAFFDASSSSDPDGTVIGFHWDFGDGSTGDGVVINHAYLSEGNFTVTLTVTDNLSGISSVQRDVSVSPPPPINNPPVAVFTFAPDPPKMGQVVLFDASGSHDDDQYDRISQYYWDFGDDTTNQTLLPTILHRYFVQGNVTVSLMVQDSLSPQQNATVQETILVGPPIRDVAISSVVASTTQVTKGGVVAITAKVRNMGSIAETCQVSLLLGSEVVDSKTVLSLNPSETSTISFFWNTLRASPGQHSLTVMAGPMPGEVNSQDNSYSIIINVKEAPGNWFTSYLPYLAGLAVAAIGIIALFITGLRRKRDARPQQT